MHGMGPGMLVNPTRPIYPKSVVDLLTDLVSRHARICVANAPCARKRASLTTPTLPGTRSTSGHWLQSIVVHLVRVSLMSCLPTRDISTD